MDKELKIAVTIFLVFLVFGIASFFNLGSFATPVFMNQFIFVIVAVSFFIMNLKAPNSWVLAIYIIICFFGLVIDEFSMGYLAEKYKNNVFLELSRSTTFSISFLVVYFGFYVFSTILLFSNTKNKGILFIQLLLIIATIFCLGLNDLPYLSPVLFSLFLLTYIYSVNSLLTRDDKVLSVLSYQYFLFLVLEGLEYFL